MRRTIYTLGRPEAELEIIRQLIAAKSGLDTAELTIYSPTTKLQYGRVWYAVVQPETQNGLIFTISRRTTPETVTAPQHVSEWEVKTFFKLAQSLDPGRVYSMLAPLRIFEDEIR